VLRAGSDALGGEKALRLLVHVAEPIAASKALEALRDFQAARRGSEGLYALFERLQCLRCTAPSFCSLLLDEWVIGNGAAMLSTIRAASSARWRRLGSLEWASVTSRQAETR
jgi:hypothetical protein